MIGYCRWKGGDQGRPYWEGIIWVKTCRKSGSRPCDWLGEECQAEARANGKALRQNCVQQCYRNSKELSAANEVREIGTRYTGPCGSFWGLWVRRRALRSFESDVIWLFFFLEHLCCCIENRLKGWTETSYYIDQTRDTIWEDTGWEMVRFCMISRLLGCRIREKSLLIPKFWPEYL